MKNDGIVSIDTEAANQFGFTSDRFHPTSYLWREGNTITVSFIVAKRKGEFCRLMKSIVQNGFDFEIPTPSGRMREIGEKQKWNLCEKYVGAIDGMIEYFTNKKLEADHDGKFRKLSKL